MRILTIGFGRLGQRVAALAAAEGHHIWGLRRSPGAHADGSSDPSSRGSRGSSGRITALQGDVGVPESLDLPGGFDRILYAVAASDPTDEGYRAAYPAGLTNALAAAQIGSPAARLVFVSSTSAFGQNGGETVDETSPTQPQGFRGLRMVEAEEVAAAWAAPSTICRLSGIYGPDRTRLLDAVRQGRATYRGGTAEWTNRIHAEDAARAIWHVMCLEAPPRTVCVTDRLPAPRREVLEWLAERIGARPPAAAPSEPETPGEAGKRIRSDLLVATGFTHLYPTFREGYADVIDSPA